MLVLTLIIFILSLIIIFICGHIHRNTKYDMESIGNIFLSSAIITGMAFLLIGVYCLCSYDPGIDKKIAMYQEENAAIEAEIAAVVETYMTYEKDFYADIKTESPIIMVSLYPELASDELVSAQINTYVSNNQQIKSLKEQQIDQDYVKWWINFNK